MKFGKQGSLDLRKLLPFLQRYKFIFLILVMGFLFLLWPQGETEKQTESGVEGTENIVFDLEELEERIEKVLSEIEGAGEVSLVLTVKGGVERIYAMDTEYSEERESRNESRTTVLISTGSGTEEAAIIQQIYPEFQGALIVCEGGDDPAVKLFITQAVSALTGLGADKITVCR